MKERLFDKIIKYLLILSSIMILYLLFELIIQNFHNFIFVFDWIYNNEMFSAFTRIFMSIIMEGFPFIIVGSIISSIIHLFVSEKTIKKFIPKRNIMGILMAGLLGVVFPVCECAIVPIMRRLMKKGLPLHIAITFMIAVPIVNPIVLFSTYYAFSSLKIALLRGVLGYIAACLVGILILIMFKKGAGNIEKKKYKQWNKNIKIKHVHNCGCSACSHDHSEENHRRGSIVEGMKGVIQHTNEELMNIGKFFIIGALISALFQVVISKDVLRVLGGNSAVSVLMMLFIAFMLSLCSEADAFIGKTFAESFSSGSVMGFLIFGPMIDLKNTLMLSGYFKKTFVLKLIFVIFAVVFIMSCGINIMGGIIL